MRQRNRSEQGSNDCSAQKRICDKPYKRTKRSRTPHYERDCDWHRMSRHGVGAWLDLRRCPANVQVKYFQPLGILYSTSSLNTVTIVRDVYAYGGLADQDKRPEVGPPYCGALHTCHRRSSSRAALMPINV